MMTINFERWPRIPQRAVGPSSLQRRAAVAHAACRRPARLAALVVGAAFCASLAMTPADARPASASAGAASAEPGVLAVDELSSRRQRGGGSAAAAKAKKAATHKSAHHKTHKSPHRKMNPWAAAAAKNRKELVRLDRAMHPKNADHKKSAKKKSADRETSPWAAAAEKNRKELARRDKAMRGGNDASPGGPRPSPSPGPPPTPPR